MITNKWSVSYLMYLMYLTIAVMIFVANAASSAFAQNEPTRTTITPWLDGNLGLQIKLRGGCMDVRGGQTQDGAPIQLWRDCIGNHTNQTFVFRDGGRLVHKASGKCVVPEDPTGVNSGIVLETCPLGPVGAPFWKYTHDLRLKHYSSQLCLQTVSYGEQLRLDNCANTRRIDFRNAEDFSYSDLLATSYSAHLQCGLFETCEYVFSFNETLAWSLIDTTSLSNASSFVMLPLMPLFEIVVADQIKQFDLLVEGARNAVAQRQCLRMITESNFPIGRALVSIGMVPNGTGPCRVNLNDLTALEPMDDIGTPSYWRDAAVWATRHGIMIPWSRSSGGRLFNPTYLQDRGRGIIALWRFALRPNPPLYNQFTDIPTVYQDLAEAVNWAVSSGVTKGTSETTFSPEEPLTRGHVVTFLYRMAGEPPVDIPVNLTPAGCLSALFCDVDESDYFYRAAFWAKCYGITRGTGDGSTFTPDRQITRAELATMMYRAKHNYQPKDGRGRLIPVFWLGRGEDTKNTDQRCL